MTQQTPRILQQPGQENQEGQPAGQEVEGEGSYKGGYPEAQVTCRFSRAAQFYAVIRPPTRKVGFSETLTGGCRC